MKIIQQSKDNQLLYYLKDKKDSEMYQGNIQVLP